MSNFISTASGLFGKRGSENQNPNKPASPAGDRPEVARANDQQTQQKIAQLNEQRMQRQQQARAGRTIGGTLGG